MLNLVNCKTFTLCSVDTTGLCCGVEDIKKKKTSAKCILTAINCKLSSRQANCRKTLIYWQTCCQKFIGKLLWNHMWTQLKENKCWNEVIFNVFLHIMIQGMIYLCLRLTYGDIKHKWQLANLRQPVSENKIIKVYFLKVCFNLVHYTVTFFKVL